MVQVEMNPTDVCGTETGGPPEPRIVSHSVVAHGGDPKGALVSAIATLDMKRFDRVAATGRRFRKLLNLTSISEPEAVEYAYRFSKPDGVNCPAVVSAGGETFMVYILNTYGRVVNVLTGNKCASGTGEFLLQQLRRMGVTLEEAGNWAAEEEPYPVSGRCSVFCKSDCTHATNKGVPKPNVTAGLCKMMAGKVLELLKKVDRKNIMVTGGTTQNRMMVAYLSEEIQDLIVPEAAPYFESLGAALWALEHETIPPPEPSDLLGDQGVPFEALPPLRDAEDMVEFKSVGTGSIQAGDECILGLDVGSTTTKAVLLRTSDDAMLATIYLRTNGDPVRASRRCYRAILDQVRQVVDPRRISIVGLGICGSGRQIAGLHALTDNVINEIIAHATAAVYFDAEVDTIFEIGGQDAKYTYITNAVPSDYAMNEACSAGTGSFLEESAFESLGVAMEEIASIALKGSLPSNFSDQCAAFISSDIKNAIHNGIGHEDIIAGLVYAVCMNYINRVKGNRPVGRKVYMQGGVCYNRAVPVAMAALTGKPIVVPPDPGLMGAYGVGLQVKKRIQTGMARRQLFDLGTLAKRDVRYGKSFTCTGGKGGCDRRCEILRIQIEGKTYPFGGACNLYYNLRSNTRYDVGKLDLVRHRQTLVFDTYGKHKSARSYVRGRVGINRSFLTNTYYPLYSTFFSEMGFDPVLSSSPSQRGIDRGNAPFCFPADLSHGFFHDLLQMEDPPDYIFLPHLKAVDVPDDYKRSVVCPLLQGEPFYLQTSFQGEIKALKEKGMAILTPLIDFTEGLGNARSNLVRMAQQMNVGRREAEAAFQKAVEQQEACRSEMVSIGKEVLRDIEADPDRIAVVLFARPYNGFVEEAHMGIPHKFASRGIAVIPYDFIETNGEDVRNHMYWGMGRMILRVSGIVKEHPQLFGTYITNFSCGPDSFILGYFRELMDQKPSLILEIDSHSADAGLETRVEAFLDIVSTYNYLLSRRQITQTTSAFVPARIEQGNGVPQVITSSGEKVPMTDRRVKLLFPSMGEIASESLAAVFRGKGYRTYVHPPADEGILRIGRGHTSCKECLPLQLTTGTLLSYIQQKRADDELLVYFFATSSGPCRFGQYKVFMEDLIRRLELEDVALIGVSSDDGYGGLGKDANKQSFWAVVIADIMEDIRSMILANAADETSGLRIFREEWQLILRALEGGNFKQIEYQLLSSAHSLRRIPVRMRFDLVPKILLTGEIFVRRDPISRQYLTERLAKSGYATICSPISEFMYYCDYHLNNPDENKEIDIRSRLKLKLKNAVMARYERRIKRLLSQSGLVHPQLIDIEGTLENASPYISPKFTGGEATLTVGSAITDVASHVCGVIAIGPFGCMPHRLSEAILNVIMTREEKLATEPASRRLHATLTDIEDLPFLAIETDGSQFPQLIHAKLEAFCLRAMRLHGRMQAAYYPDVSVATAP